MNSKLKNYFLAKTDPAMAMAIYLEGVDRMVQKKLEDIMANVSLTATTDFENRLGKVKDQIPGLAAQIGKELTAELKEEFNKHSEKFRGLEGKPGKSIMGKPGARGKKGERGPAPIAGIDFPSHKEIEKQIERIFRDKSLKKGDLMPMVSKIIEKALKKTIKEIDAAKIARMI